MNGTLVDGREVARSIPDEATAARTRPLGPDRRVGVKPLDSRWQEILVESIRGFEERQTVI
jgi:hypothetical protein